MKIVIVEKYPEMGAMAALHMRMVLGSSHEIVILNKLADAPAVIHEHHEDATAVFIACGPCNQGAGMARMIRRNQPTAVVVLTSTDDDNRELAEALGFPFMPKRDYEPTRLKSRLTELGILPQP